MEDREGGDEEVDRWVKSRGAGEEEEDKRRLPGGEEGLTDQEEGEQEGVTGQIASSDSADHTKPNLLLFTLVTLTS